MVKALETVIADSNSGKWAQYHATRCLASLCLDPDLTNQLADWEYTHQLLLDNLKCDDGDLVDAAAEAFHNLLASNRRNRGLFGSHEDLMERMVKLAGEGEGRACGMHAVGGLFQLVRASKEFAKEMIQHPTLAAQLVRTLHFGSDKAKELSCAVLAILGENDDDVSSLDDDVLNMQIAMSEGSFDALQELFIRGSPQQAMHATAVLSNVLISAGSFMKTQLAENEEFLQGLLKFIESAGPLHRTYAIRLVYNMMKEDYHIIELVGRLPRSIAILMELLDAGNPDQRLYACQSVAEMVSVEEMAAQVGAHNRGHIFKILLQILKEPRSLLKGSALEILRMLAVDDANKAIVIRIEGLVVYLAEVARNGLSEHSISASGILLELSRFTSDLRATLATDDTFLEAVTRLLQRPGISRRYAADLIFSLASERENLTPLMQLPEVLEVMGDMMLQGEDADKGSACGALWKLLEHEDVGLKTVGRASQIVLQLVHIMEEKDENGYLLASDEREGIVLSAMLQMCKDEYGCSIVALVPGIFRMLTFQASREGLGDGHPHLAIGIIRTLMQRNTTCWQVMNQSNVPILDITTCLTELHPNRDTMLKEPNAVPVLLNAIRVTNASIVKDALVILEMLSEKSRGAQGHVIEANKDKGDVWDTLLSFTDDKITDESIFKPKEYDRERHRAFAVLTMLASGNQAVCARISQKRVSTDIIAKCIMDSEG